MNLWSIKDLNKRIAKFRSESAISESVEQIKDSLYEFYNVYNITAVNIGNRPVFRVRKIEDGTSHSLNTDVWCPPAKYGKLGRANDDGETIFYGAFDPLTAIQEGRINQGDYFSLAVYYLLPMDDWNLTSVVINTPKEGVSQTVEMDEFSLALNKFMIKEFTRIVEHGEEKEYKISCAISKILLDLPNKDSILYPSMKNKNKVNIAIKEENAKERLKLKSVVKCNLLKFNEDGTADIDVVSLAQAKDDIDILIPDKIPQHKKTISYHTWVKKELDFYEAFHSKNIKSPSEIIEELLKKRK